MLTMATVLRHTRIWLAVTFGMVVCRGLAGSRGDIGSACAPTLGQELLAIRDAVHDPFVNEDQPTATIVLLPRKYDHDLLQDTVAAINGPSLVLDISTSTESSQAWLSDGALRQLGSGWPAPISTGRDANANERRTIVFTGIDRLNSSNILALDVFGRLMDKHTVIDLPAGAGRFTTHGLALLLLVPVPIQLPAHLDDGLWPTTADEHTAALRQHWEGLYAARQASDPVANQRRLNIDALMGRIRQHVVLLPDPPAMAPAPASGECHRLLEPTRRQRRAASSLSSTASGGTLSSYFTADSPLAVTLAQLSSLATDRLGLSPNVMAGGGMVVIGLLMMACTGRQTVAAGGSGAAAAKVSATHVGRGKASATAITAATPGTGSAARGAGHAGAHSGAAAASTGRGRPQSRARGEPGDHGGRDDSGDGVQHEEDTSHDGEEGEEEDGEPPRGRLGVGSAKPGVRRRIAAPTPAASPIASSAAAPSSHGHGHGRPRSAAPGKR